MVLPTVSSAPATAPAAFPARLRRLFPPFRIALPTSPATFLAVVKADERTAAEVLTTFPTVLPTTLSPLWISPGRLPMADPAAAPTW